MSVKDNVPKNRAAVWRKYYSEDRPHGAIGNKPPVSLMTPAGASSPRA
jgi:putative transposase